MKRQHQQQQSSSSSGRDAAAAASAAAGARSTASAATDDNTNTNTSNTSNTSNSSSSGVWVGTSRRTASAAAAASVSGTGGSAAGANTNTGTNGAIGADASAASADADTNTGTSTGAGNTEGGGGEEKWTRNLKLPQNNRRRWADVMDDDDDDDDDDEYASNDAGGARRAAVPAPAPTPAPPPRKPAWGQPRSQAAASSHLATSASPSPSASGGRASGGAASGAASAGGGASASNSPASRPQVMKKKKNAWNVPAAPTGQAASSLQAAASSLKTAASSSQRQKQQRQQKQQQKSGVVNTKQQQQQQGKKVKAKGKATAWGKARAAKPGNAKAASNPVPMPAMPAAAASSSRKTGIGTGTGTGTGASGGSSSNAVGGGGGGGGGGAWGRPAPAPSAAVTAAAASSGPMSASSAGVRPQQQQQQQPNKSSLSRAAAAKMKTASTSGSGSKKKPRPSDNRLSLGALAGLDSGGSGNGNGSSGSGKGKKSKGKSGGGGSKNIGSGGGSSGIGAAAAPTKVLRREGGSGGGVEDFPSLQITMEEFPSLSSQPSGGGAAATATNTAAGPSASTRRGWESAKTHPAAAAAPTKSTAKGSAARKEEKDTATGSKKQQQQQTQQKKQKKQAAASSPEPKQTKKKAKKDKGSISITDHPKLMQGLKAPRKQTDTGLHVADDAHAAHMITLKSGQDLTGKKGRQRLGPRKKRLSTLKKKVLQERLRTWREMTGIKEDGESEVDTTSAAGDTTANDEKKDGDEAALMPFFSVCLESFVDPSELEDDDEYIEIVSDLINLAEKVGKVDEIYIPRGDNDGGKNDLTVGAESSICLAFVRFEKESDARAAIACWDSLTIGGNKVRTTSVVQDGSSTNAKGEEWKKLMLQYDPTNAATTHVDTDAAMSEASGTGTCTVILENILTGDDYEDEDCLAESIEDIKALTMQFGTVVDLISHISGDMKGQVHVVFEGGQFTAERIVGFMNGMIIGGQSLSARVQSTVSKKSADDTSGLIILEDILSEDDLEDEDCMQESIEDIMRMCGQIGEIKNIKAHTDGDTKGQVHVTFVGGRSAAEEAVSALNDKIIGGDNIKARLVSPQTSSARNATLILRNLIDEDGFEDEDELEETKSDILELVKGYGTIEDFHIILEGENKGQVHVTYTGGEEVTLKAQSGINGIVRGGQIIEAELLSSKGEPNAAADATSSEPATPASSESPAPLYSGDKVIPERYAEMKRVPKVPNKGIPREYATKVDDDNVIPLINEMLGELMRLQIRNKDDKNARARRRLVMGLREVARGIRSHKVKMVIMANNLDEYGAIDEKLQEILDSAANEDVPVFFELSKRRLGKSLGKTIKVAVVGIQNADGAYQPFKKLQRLYSTAPRKLAEAT